MKDIEENDIEDYKIDQISYNESLKMFNEAKKDVDEIKESMKKTNSEIDKNIEIQNEVRSFIDWLLFSLVFIVESIHMDIMVDG